MKNILPFLFGAALLPLAAQAQSTSNVVGYTTETLQGDGAYNLIGLTLHNPIEVVGSITALAGTTVTDGAVDFTTALTAGTTYVMQITSGAQDGAIQVVDTWAGNDLTTPQDLGALGVAVGDTYQLREVATLSSIFGAANEAGLLEGDIATADIIWIPIGGGGFAKFFYSPGSVFPPVAEGWKSASGAAADSQPIVYTDGMFIQRRGAGPLDLVVAGEVETSTVQLLAEAGNYNYVSTIFPVGSTLGNCGLEATLLHGDIATADVLWMQKADRSGYDKFFYTDGSVFPPVTAGWKNAAGADATNQALTSGMIIQRRGATDVAPGLTPPPSYASL